MPIHAIRIISGAKVNIPRSDRKLKNCKIIIIIIIMSPQFPIHQIVSNPQSTYVCVNYPRTQRRVACRDL